MPKAKCVARRQATRVRKWCWINVWSHVVAKRHDMQTAHTHDKRSVKYLDFRRRRAMSCTHPSTLYLFAMSQPSVLKFCETIERLYSSKDFSF